MTKNKEVRTVLNFKRLKQKGKKKKHRRNESFHNLALNAKIQVLEKRVF